MANHVYFNISVEGLNDEQWDSLFTTEERTNKNYEGKDYTFTDLVEIEHQPFMSKVDKEFDDDNFLMNAYNWYCDNVGAKWCNIEEWKGSMITGYSAWTTPYEMVNNLMEYASDKFDIPLSAKMTYEDEFRNFIGVDYFETFEEDGEYCCSHTEEYVDGNDLNIAVEEHFDCDVSDEDFNWWDERKNQYGEMQVPSDFADEVVYEFFETGEWAR